MRKDAGRDDGWGRWCGSRCWPGAEGAATNVLISAALRPDGPPRAVVDAVHEARGVLLFSDETFDELRSRFHRPKFDRYVGRQVRAEYLAQLEAVSEWVSIVGAKLGCRDPDDDKLLETALMGAADCLVTGDRDLLEMSPFHDIPILTPAGFLDLRTIR